MLEPAKKIKFDNKQNPDSHFDLINLEFIFQRDYVDHSPSHMHRVDFYILFFVEEGQGMHTIDFQDYDCSKGTLLTIRKDQLHKFWDVGDLKGKLLIFTNEFLVSYLEELEAQKTMLLFNELLGVPKLKLDDHEFAHIQQSVLRIANEYFEINDTHSLGIIRSELHILITYLFRIKALAENVYFENRYVKEFVAFQNLVEKHVVETNKVKDYAQMMGISTKTLNTITRSIVHKSAKEFVDEICTKQIKRLLINTELSIKEVSHQAGFEETTNFYKYFKRQTQMTPEQFRARK